MNRKSLVLLAALALCAASWTPGARAYDVPQVCLDAFSLQSQHDKENLDTVIDLYTQCLGGDLSPKNRGTVFYNRGNARKNQGDLSGAVLDYTRALEHRPDYDKAFYNRGNTKDDQGDFPGAVADYTRAIEANPGHALAYGNRAFTYKKMGELEKAKADSEKALAIDPDVRVPSF